MTGTADDDLPDPQPPCSLLLLVLTRTVSCCPSQVMGSVVCAAYAGPARPASPAPVAMVRAATAAVDLVRLCIGVPS